MPGGEIVTAIQHHIGIQNPFAQAVLVQALHQRPHLDIGVQRAQGVPPRFGLGPPQARHVMQDLALQVAELDDVVVHQRDPPHTRGGQVQRRRRPQATCADNQRMGRQQTLLAFDAELVEQDMPGIARQPRVVQDGFVPHHGILISPSGVTR